MPLVKIDRAIALSALGLTETVESQQEKVKFALYGDRASEKWQVVWARQQFKCRSRRGHQD